jgi:serine protease Do
MPSYKVLFMFRLICASIVVLLSATALAAEETAVVKRVTNATVLIRTNLLHGFAEDREATGRWIGSGFLIDKGKGWIVTNRHVAGVGPAELKIQFVDSKKKIPAERVYVDSKHDLAILKIEPSILPERAEVINLDCTYRLNRGDKVAAVGHPEGHHFTATLGVLSGRKDLGVDGMLYTTDMVTEPGSSGSAVVLIETGNVIGVSTAGYDSSDLGLLTRARDLCPIYELLQRGEDPSRPLMAFQMLMVDGEISNRVGHVFNESVGLKSGDLILTVGGELWDPVEDGELEDSLRKFNNGATLLTVQRDGTEIDVELPIAKRGSLHNRDWVYFSGMMLAESPHRDINFRNGGRAGAFVTIQSVDDSHDDATELEYDDYSDVISIDGTEIMSLKQAYDILKRAADEGRRIPMIAREWDITPEAIGYQFEHTFEVEDLSSSFSSPE